MHDYLELWNWDRTLERIHHALYVAQREEEGREANPTVAIINSQSARKRHILVDTLGLLLNVVLNSRRYSGHAAGFEVGCLNGVDRRTADVWR